MFARSRVSVYHRVWWKLKPGPVVTDGRLAHVYLAACLATGPALFGTAALRASLNFILPGFVAWELLFPLLCRINEKWGGRHPFGDVIDLGAFLLGWAIGIWVVFLSWRG